MFDMFALLPPWFGFAVLLLVVAVIVLLLLNERIVLEAAEGAIPRYREAAHALFARAADLLRAWPLLALFLITFAYVLHLNPAKAGLAVWGLSKLAGGGFIGYWCDRVGFRPEDRPHRLEGISKGTAWKRRAIIIAAAIVAAALIP